MALYTGQYIFFINFVLGKFCPKEVGGFGSSATNQTVFTKCEIYISFKHTYQRVKIDLLGQDPIQASSE